MYSRCVCEHDVSFLIEATPVVQEKIPNALNYSMLTNKK